MRTHLGEMVDHDVPVSVIYQGRHIPACRFVRINEPTQGLHLLVRRRNAGFSGGDRLSVSYNFASYIYTFETEIRAVEAISPDSALVNLSQPKQIARLERRKSYRVQPAEDDPVRIRILSPDTEIVTDARDMGRHGAAFLLPSSVPGFQAGSAISLLIHLPKLGPVRLDAVVRNSRGSAMDGYTQYGVEFIPPADFDSPLAQYVHWRKLEAHNARNADARSKNKSVLVAIKESPEGTYAFVCSSSSVQEIADFNAFSEIVSADVMDFIE